MIDFRETLDKNILNQESVTTLGSDVIILDRPVLAFAEIYPYKNDWLIATLCEKGSARGTINLRDYNVEEGGFIVILPGQVIVRSNVSEDFQGKIVLMSSKFARSLDIGKSLTFTATIEQRPYYKFENAAIEIVQAFINSCKTMIRLNGDQQMTREVIRLLVQAFFIGATPLLSSRYEGTAPYSKLTEDFLALVENDYRANRKLDYYASKLGRNAKYLSRHIKEETGRNATEWIRLCVINDAQAQLVSTKKTILEISDSLGFPSQSFFGKYFKRYMGISPKEFRT